MVNGFCVNSVVFENDKGENNDMQKGGFLGAAAVCLFTRAWTCDISRNENGFIAALCF